MNCIICVSHTLTFAVISSSLCVYSLIFRTTFKAKVKSTGDSGACYPRSYLILPITWNLSDMQPSTSTLFSLASFLGEACPILSLSSLNYFVCWRLTIAWNQWRLSLMLKICSSVSFWFNLTVQICSFFLEFHLYSPTVSIWYLM